MSVYLAGDRDTIAVRLAVRQGHFMPPQLLDSQFADLEEPGPDEPALRVNVGDPSPAIVGQVIERLGLLLPAVADPVRGAAIAVRPDRWRDGDGDGDGRP